MNLVAGAWTGTVAVSAESLSNAFSVSGGGVTSAWSDSFNILVPHAEKDMNYPNPFSALRESTTIRFYMPEDGNADIRIYTLTGDMVREWSIDARAGINLLSWDGKDGGGTTVGSGGYLCAIWKKGFKSVWNSGLSNKPIIVKIGIIN
jgi:hypothetical protein